MTLRDILDQGVTIEGYIKLKMKLFLQKNTHGTIIVKDFWLVKFLVCRQKRIY